MAKNYRKILRAEADKLASNAKSPFDNTTAKGDGREDLILAFLRERVGSAFGVTKGEIIDSVGKSTGEYDAIIYDQRAASAVASEGNRAVVRVEAVAATVEVKSILETKHLKELFAHQNKEILQLLRFYRPTPWLRALGKFTKSWDDTERVFAAGLCPMMHHENIPTVVSFVFAFSGLGMDSVGEWLQFPGVDVICVLGSYTVAKQRIGFSANPPDLQIWAEQEDALGAFLFLIEDCLEKHIESRQWVAPEWRRYFFSPELLQAESRKTGRS